MSGAPDRCPTCGTELIEGRPRCVGCGRVFGEDNRCPHCHAIAAVVPAGEMLVCMACNGERERKPGTVVIEGTPRGLGRVLPLPSTARLDGTRQTVGSATVTRAAATGLRTVGALSIGLGVLATAALFATLPLSWAVVGAIVAGGGGVALGAWALRGAARSSERADTRDRTEIEQALMKLAEASDGDLTVTEVARARNVSLQEAEDALTQIADGSRVAVEVDADGIVHYVFRELQRLSGASPRVRIDAALTPEPVEEVVETDAAASRRTDESA